MIYIFSLSFYCNNGGKFRLPKSLWVPIQSTVDFEFVWFSEQIEEIVVVQSKLMQII